MLEVDGEQLGQTTVICRYLGEKHNMAPEDPWIACRLQEAVEYLHDVSTLSAFAFYFRCVPLIIIILFLFFSFLFFSFFLRVSLNDFIRLLLVILLLLLLLLLLRAFFLSLMVVLSHGDTFESQNREYVPSKHLV